MNIRILRNLVNQGLNIENRRSLRATIPSEDVKQFETMLKKHVRVPIEYTTPFQEVISIPLSKISLSREHGNIVLKFITAAMDLFSEQDTQTFVGKKINIQNIKTKINNFYKKLIEIPKDKNFPDSAFEAKTIKQLYSSKYRQNTKLNKDGYYVTSVIDKKTKEPVNIYIKRIEETPEEIECDSIEFENWGVFRKDNDNNYKLIGKRSFEVDQFNKKINPGWMDSLGGNKELAGIGLIEHEIGIRRMLEEGFKHIVITAKAEAFPFHYKSGFRVKPKLYKRTQECIDRIITIYSLQTGIKPEILKKLIITKTHNGKLFYDSRSEENIYKYIFTNNIQGDIDCIDMELYGDNLNKWIERIKKYPIF